MRKLGIVIASIVLFVSISSICYVFTNSLTANDQTEQKENQENNESVLLLDDNIIKVSYDKVFEEKSVDGLFYLGLLIENKSDKEVSIYISDVSVNDTTASAGSDIPPTAKPGNSVYAVYFISYNDANISSLEQIKNINFRLMIIDDSRTTYTDYIDIDFE